VVDADFKNIILFSSCKEGYVSLDAWNEIDPKELIETISENTEKENIERQKIGGGELHAVGWMQEPTLDKHTNTIFWAIEAMSPDEGNIVNSVAIRLGREGYERITWISKKASYVPFGGDLDVMLRAHSFDPGFRYTDYTPGDKIASYGIATLVAATVGGKIVKAGGFLLLFKKFGGFIFAGIAAIFYKSKKIFKRKKED
jgi:uncharacterized membrane-anchored protein